MIFEWVFCEMDQQMRIGERASGGPGRAAGAARAGSTSALYPT